MIWFLPNFQSIWTDHCCSDNNEKNNWTSILFLNQNMNEYDMHKNKVKNKKYHSHLMLTILAFKKKVLPFRGKHKTSTHIIDKVLV